MAEDFVRCPRCGEAMSLPASDGGTFHCVACGEPFDVAVEELPAFPELLDRTRVDRIAKLKRAEARELARRRVLAIVALAAALQLVVLAMRDTGSARWSYAAAAAIALWLSLRLALRKPDHG